MTTQELNQVINEITRPDFDHVSKTYSRGLFLNVAYSKERHTINLNTTYEEACAIITSLRKQNQ